MKYFSFIALMFLGLLLNAQPQLNYHAEELLLEDMFERAEAMQFDLDSAFAWQEGRLRAEGFLNGNEAADFYALFQSMWEGNQPNFERLDELTSSFFEVSDDLGSHTPPLELFYTTSHISQACMEFSGSKLADCAFGMAGMNGIPECLNEDDFEHPFYKSFIYVTLWRVADMDRGLSSPLELSLSDVLNESSTGLNLEILVLPNKQVAMNGVPLPAAAPEVKERVLSFFETVEPRIEHIVNGRTILLPPQDLVIYLKTKPEVEYTHYIDIQNEIVAAYRTLRNQTALDLFDTPFDELEPEHRALIQRLIPQNIQEE